MKDCFIRRRFKVMSLGSRAHSMPVWLWVRTWLSTDEALLAFVDLYLGWNRRSCPFRKRCHDQVKMTRQGCYVANTTVVPSVPEETQVLCKQLSWASFLFHWLMGACAVQLKKFSGNDDHSSGLQTKLRVFSLTVSRVRMSFWQELSLKRNDVGNMGFLQIIFLHSLS